ncbi:LytTR family transcriptional regulator [Sporanaerobium hydrogeniformans]|uniref:LytTR family transcriptional regulator n=1 Tax=Sporanaerobium hydrogeniformans TaxID=3072179 RepID=A0AC61DB61_9FIRM|nr:LytTR family DNA-binding domain-containing protein [Sporanaerobium hydrogeniformans]PHV70499.1 LytTR family transcriptional regulator [Sporanaerobium hydrogeniformans]
MLQIAICDDDQKELSILTTLIREYLTINKISAELFEFSHPDALLSSCESCRFHLYILDIVMPMVDGISLGKALRRLDREAQIIYATTEPQFALQAFAANPINFLVKPVSQQALFSTLTLALSKVEAEDETLAVKTKEGIFVVSVRIILCCEYIGRGVTYQLASGEKLHSLSSTQSFAEQIAPLLIRSDFLQPHISFAVNLRHVEQLTREEIRLCGGISVPVSKKQYTTVRDRYLDFRLAREGQKR